MAPFRAPPEVELGPLDVGLAKRAAEAMARLPRGGRLVARIAHEDARAVAAYRVGALGSVGLVLALFAAVALATSAEPSGVGLGPAIVAAAAVSLALVLRALDGGAIAPTESGRVVGRAARRVLGRWVWLAQRTEASPSSFSARHLAALRRGLALARDRRAIRAWMPRDVIGRAELLAARGRAVLAGRGWFDDSAVRDDVETLLCSAASNLDDPTPARADLDVLERASARVHSGGGRRVEEPAIDDGELPLGVSAVHSARS